MKPCILFCEIVERGQETNAFIEELGDLPLEAAHFGQCGICPVGNCNPALFKPCTVSSLALGFRTTLTGRGRFVEHVWGITLSAAGNLGE
jgi:hypothetical protein